MNLSICIGTYGSLDWATLARERALPSAEGLGCEVLCDHDAIGSLATIRNRLAYEAEGDWLAFLDADDQLDPGYVAAMVEVAAQLERDARFGVPSALLVPAVRYRHMEWGDLGWSSWDEEPRIPNTHHPFDEVNHAVIGTLVPRSLFRFVGGFRELPMYEDWDLWLRCLRAGARLIYAPRAIYIAYLDVAVASRNRNEAEAASTYKLIRDEHMVWARRP